MRIIIHIGTEKTGTSSIQEFLHKNREVLIKHGFYLLKFAGPKNNLILPRFCMREDRFDDCFEENRITTIEQKRDFRKRFKTVFINEIENLPGNIHTVICSSEHFHSRTIYQDELAALKDLIVPYFDKISILVYFRRQIDMSISLYSTSLKCGGTQSLEDFVRHGCKTNNPFYNYQQILELWSSAFGHENIIARLFSKDEFINSNLLYDFLSQIDPNLLNVGIDFDIHQANQSIDEFGQILIKHINKQFPRFDKKQGFNEINQKLHNLILPITAGKGESFDSKEAEEIQDQFYDSNEQLRKKWFPHKETIFETKVISSPNMLFKKQHENVTKIISNSNTIFKKKHENVTKIISSSNTIFTKSHENITKVISSSNTIFTKNHENVIASIIHLLAKHIGQYPNSWADTIRDSAILLENQNIDKSLALMRMAKSIRPNGGFITKKLDEYENIVKNKKHGGQASRCLDRLRNIFLARNKKA